MKKRTLQRHLCLTTVAGLLLLVLVGCKKNDPAPVLPDPVVQVLQSRFPRYEQLKVTPLEAKKVWQATLTSGDTLYELVVSQSKILSIFRAIDTPVPAELVKKTNASVLAEGAFSDYMIRVEPQELFYQKMFKAQYVWNGTNYYVDWNNLIHLSGMANFYPDVVSKYLTRDMDDLPQTIQEIINSKVVFSKNTPPRTIPRPVEFSQAWVYVHKDQKKSYEIKLSLAELHIGQENQVLFWDYSQGHDSTFAVLTRQEQLPPKLSDYLQNDPLARKFPKFLALRFTDNGRMGYNPRISKDRMVYSLFFDDSATMRRHFFYLYF